MPVPDSGFRVEVMAGVPVVAAPEDIDITNAAGLRTALLKQPPADPGTVVVDMSRTQFCDTAGIHALVTAHKRARAEGRRVLLVIGGAAISDNHATDTLLRRVGAGAVNATAARLGLTSTVVESDVQTLLDSIGQDLGCAGWAGLITWRAGEVGSVNRCGRAGFPGPWS